MILADIYRSGLGDCTNGGVSSRTDRVYVTTDPDAPATHEGLPVLVLVSHVRGCVSARPPLAARPSNDTHAGPMMGGNYVATSDSRFGAMVEKLLGHRFYGAIAIHDRFDTWRDHERLSR